MAEEEKVYSLIEIRKVQRTLASCSNQDDMIRLQKMGLAHNPKKAPLVRKTTAALDLEVERFRGSTQHQQSRRSRAMKYFQGYQRKLNDALQSVIDAMNLRELAIHFCDAVQGDKAHAEKAADHKEVYVEAVREEDAAVQKAKDAKKRRLEAMREEASAAKKRTRLQPVRVEAFEDEAEEVDDAEAEAEEAEAEAEAAEQTEEDVEDEEAESEEAESEEEIVQPLPPPPRKKMPKAPSVPAADEDADVDELASNFQQFMPPGSVANDMD